MFGVDMLCSRLRVLEGRLFNLLDGLETLAFCPLSRAVRALFDSKYSGKAWIVACGGRAYSISKSESTSRIAEIVPKATDVTVSSSVKETIVFILAELSESSWVRNSLIKTGAASARLLALKKTTAGVLDSVLISVYICDRGAMQVCAPHLRLRVLRIFIGSIAPVTTLSC